MSEATLTAGASGSLPTRLGAAVLVLILAEMFSATVHAQVSPTATPTTRQLMSQPMSACGLVAHNYGKYAEARDRGVPESRYDRPPRADLQGGEEAELIRRKIVHEIYTHPDWRPEDVSGRYMLRCMEEERRNRRPPKDVETLIDE
jgi:hypothetical protein